jgi:hypothetical protein
MEKVEFELPVEQLKDITISEQVSVEAPKKILN